MPVRTLIPTSNTTPDQGGTLAVTGNSNTGHASTNAAANVTALAPSGANSADQAKSCRWSSFQSPPVGEQIASIRLKFTWAAQSTIVETPAADGSADANATFVIEYSLNNGSSWTAVTSQSGVFNTGASENIALTASQNISQVQVRDRMDTEADAVAGTVDNSVAQASVTAEISSIQLELTTAFIVPPVLIT